MSAAVDEFGGAAKRSITATDEERQPSPISPPPTTTPPPPPQQLVGAPRQCHLCGLVCRGNLRRHQRRAHSTYECAYCQRTFAHRIRLRQHFRTEHGFVAARVGVGAGRTTADDAVPPPFACDRCDKRYRTASALRAHCAYAHDDVAASCPECGRRFRNGARLRAHRVRHGERRFACGLSLAVAEGSSTCERRFYRAQELREHERRVHRGDRRFECDACGRRFKAKQQVREHLEVRGRCKGTPEAERADVERRRLRGQRRRAVVAGGLLGGEKSRAVEEAEGYRRFVERHHAVRL